MRGGPLRCAMDARLGPRTGGTALAGGRGTIIGTVLGIFILRVMRNGIVLIGVPGLAYNIFIGAIILGMMALHSWLERRHQAGD